MAIKGVIKTVQLPGENDSYNIEAASAGKLTSEKIISASGDVEWKVSFDGSKNVSSGAVIKSVPWSAISGLTGIISTATTAGIAAPSAVADAIANAISNVYQIMGTTTCENLSGTNFTGKHNGYVYNVSTSGKIPAAQSHEGSEININAGDNVVWISASPAGWDKLANTLDVSAYVTESELMDGSHNAYFNNISAKENVSISGNLTATGISGNSVTANTITGNSAKYTNVSATSITGINVSATSVSAAAISSTDVSAKNISGTSAKYDNVSATNITGANVSADKISGTDAKYTNITGTSVSATNISGTSAIYNGISANTITGKLAGYSAISSFVNTAAPTGWSALSSESANNPISQGRVYSALSSLADEFSNDISALKYSAYYAEVENDGNLKFSYTQQNLFK